MSRHLHIKRKKAAKKEVVVEAAPAPKKAKAPAKKAPAKPRRAAPKKKAAKAE
tara:strand:- start:5 stop:163 length:159 start_codon:yes stop_codon:yes gene_type:complete